jgi:serine/threonine protein kinase
MIVEPVPETPMTSVYKATYTTDGRSAALRVSNAALLADPDRLRGLLESANQIASVQHQNILRIFDIGGEGGRFYQTPAAEYGDQSGVQRSDVGPAGFTPRI